ncbi:MAG: polymer-forming cytoskeletal protein [Lachnospiraceae bacterium]|nr:polymer-forming cytoskeletal protein [Lachnospiraceae bacterium]
MGFFGDLKQDLSVAVNELLPDEAEQTAEAMSGNADAEKETIMPEETGTAISLDELLANIDEIKIPESEVAEDSETVAQKDRTSEEAENEEMAESQKDAESMELESMLEDILKTEEAPSFEDKGEQKKMDTYTSRMASDETSIITAGMTINGDVTTEGSLDIVGNVNGNLEVLGKLNITGHVNGNSKAAEIYAESAKINGEVVSEGAVKIGASTVIIGNITATSAAIAGAVKGDIDVRGPVVLDASAIVMGNIKSKSVQINNGAVIEGMCSQCYADVSPTAFFDDYKPEKKKNAK